MKKWKGTSSLVETYCTTVFPEETEKSHDIFIWYGKCMIMFFYISF